MLRLIFKSRVHAFLAIVAIFTLLNVSVRSLFLNSDKELIYDYSQTAFVCLKDSSQCTYIGNLKLANTGAKTLETLSILIKNIPNELDDKIRILNLNAGNPRKQNPSVEVSRSNSDRVIKILHLSPGTLVNVEYQGSFPVEKRKLISNLAIEIDSNAVVIEGDPQGTEIAKLLSVFL